MKQKKEIIFSFGENLRRLRFSRGFTQNDVSKRAGGLSQSAITQLEHDKIDPTLETIFKLSKALSVSPYKLIQHGSGVIDLGDFEEANSLDELEPETIKRALKLAPHLKRLKLV